MLHYFHISLYIFSFLYFLVKFGHKGKIYCNSKSDLCVFKHWIFCFHFRACTVENFGETIQFLVEVGCRVTHNILNWIRVKNPDCVERIETELCTPKTLARQARLAVWSCLRRANKIRNFATITEALSEANQPNNGNEIYIPNILVDYLNCK